MSLEPDFPRLRAVGDQGLLVEFGETVDEDVSERVLAFDAALNAERFEGFTESIPAYASCLVGYDPRVTDRRAVEHIVDRLLSRRSPKPRKPRTHKVPVCYEPPYSRDLAEVARRTGLSVEEVVALHLSALYRVYMFGFAPGYAYLGGVPEPLRLPRKTDPLWGIPAGSLLIAGPQCLVTTLRMPTGWWIIGRSPERILQTESERPVLFEVGDRIRFERIGADDFERLAAAGGGA